MSNLVVMSYMKPNQNSKSGSNVCGGNSLDSNSIPLIITTGDHLNLSGYDGERQPMLPRSPTDLESSFKAKSCRSFVRQKNISSEHRNKSVPHNLQVHWQPLVIIGYPLETESSRPPYLWNPARRTGGGMCRGGGCSLFAASEVEKVASVMKSVSIVFSHTSHRWWWWQNKCAWLVTAGRGEGYTIKVFKWPMCCYLDVAITISWSVSWWQCAGAISHGRQIEEAECKIKHHHLAAAPASRTCRYCVECQLKESPHHHLLALRDGLSAYWWCCSLIHNLLDYSNQS